MAGETRTDCRYFNGFKPCNEHKLHGTDCNLKCKSYSPINMRILIIKTGAAGDVIRTTPLLRKLRELHPDAEITWLTKYPELVPTAGVDHKVFFDWENSLGLLHQKFNLLINLDKSAPEAGIANRIEADIKKGFLCDKNGKILPADKDAKLKWLTGFDDVQMKKNKKHFISEVFEICGYEFNEETYWLDESAPWKKALPPKRPIIGLNTGCGERWQARLWPEENFESLAKLLIERGYTVVFLGGPGENEKNHMLAQKTGGIYMGQQPLKDFVSIVDACDVIVTSVTMALHIAIAKKKRILLFNNIFPTNEFYLYGLGEILEPKLKCQACYKSHSDLHCPVQDCMNLVTIDHAFSAVERQLSYLPLKKSKAVDFSGK